MNSTLRTSGYSLVEVLVSISILLVVIAGPMTIASRSIQYANNSRLETTAFFLAQEGVEYMSAIRNKWAIIHFYNDAQDSWQWDSQSGQQIDRCIEQSVGASTKWCGVDTRNLNLFTNIVNCSGSASTNCRLFLQGDGLYTHESGGSETPFTRLIRVQRVNGHIYKVTSRVEWEAVGGTIKDVTLETYLYDIYR